MTNHYIHFLKASTPKSLLESISQVGNLSARFCCSWLANETDGAAATSEEAFQHFDHIQNELLRHRDDKSKLSGWSSDPLKLALNVRVGDLLDPATPSDKVFFESLLVGQGAFPINASLAPLTLEVALNKLKHRSTSLVNFTVSGSSGHVLYFFTNAGNGKKDTISRFDVQRFCTACKTAAETI